MATSAMLARDTFERTFTWETLKPGLEVLRLWEMPQQPEVAILRLSNAQYEEFMRDKKEFLNTHHIFSKDVNRLCAESESRPDLEEYQNVSGDDAWLVMIEHDITSYFVPHSMLMFRPKR